MKMPCVRVPREEGEATRRELVDRGLLDFDYEIDEADGWVYLPVEDSTAVAGEFPIVPHDVAPRQSHMTARDQLPFDPTYERLGDVALLDEPDPGRAREAAEAIMRSDLPVNTVVNKASEVKGEERIRDWEVLAGNGTETVHREYGCEFALDIGAVYFSPRLATERHRVVEQVEPTECVFDMFAGVGPFAVSIAKRGAEVVAVDVNPAAIAYLRENITRNDVENAVTAVEGDVRSVGSNYPDWADRIVMNLPHSADDYLNTAVEIANDECIIHYYDIQSDTEPFAGGEAAIRAAAPEYDVAIETRRIVRSYSPHEVNICLDARLSR